MLTQILNTVLVLVVLAGLTAAALLVCLAKWSVLAAWEVHRRAWMPKRCDFCAGYWLSVLLLAGTAGAAVHWLLLPAWLLLLPVPLGLPAAAVCRAVVGQV